MGKYATYRNAISRKVAQCWGQMEGSIGGYTGITVISAIMPPPLDVKGGIIAEKVVPVFSESSFLACFGLVM